VGLAQVLPTQILALACSPRGETVRGLIDRVIGFFSETYGDRPKLAAKPSGHRSGFKAGDNAADDMVLEHCSHPMADKFQVSPKQRGFGSKSLGSWCARKKRRC
jgi:hypothetical protein